MPGVRLASVALLAIVGALVLGGGAASATAGTVAYVVMYSDTGDWIGGGTQREFDPGNGSIAVGGSASYLTVSVDGGTSGDYYDMDFAAAPGDVLTSGGIYTDAQRAPFRDAGHPGIDISGSGRGCLRNPRGRVQRRREDGGRRVRGVAAARRERSRRPAGDAARHRLHGRRI